MSSIIPTIGIPFWKTRGGPPSEVDLLVKELEGQKLPRRMALAVAVVVRDSWRAYEAFWAVVSKADPVGEPATPDERLLANMIAVGFLTTPKYFVRSWMGHVCREALFRRADPRRWAVWSTRHPLFVDLGERAAVLYCGDPTRFTTLIKELTR